MASSSEQEGKSIETMEEQLSVAKTNTDENVDEGANTKEKSCEGISMFCKACLHPYSGERKTGTLVLKCERCGQTDVILEDDASELKTEEWCGNLMMNRFMQVLKEQEDLCLNIADPFFAEDEYRGLHLAISEYTFNMKAVAERMYDIADKAASTLADYYEKEAKKEMENEGKEQDGAKIQKVAYVLPESVRRHLKHLGPTVLTLMEELIQKYELPMEILDKVKDRIRNPTQRTNTEEEDETEREDTGQSKEEEEKAGGEMKHFEEGVNDQTDTVETVNEAVSEAASGAESGIDAGSEKKNVTDDKESDDNKEEDEDFVIFNVSKSMLEKEVFDALQHKFELKFDSAAPVADKSKGENDSNTEPAQESEEGATASASTENEGGQENPKKHIDNDVHEARTILNNVEGLRTFVLETTSDDPQTVDTDRTVEEPIEVNFYAVSSAFINELQERKCKALMERKDQALATVNQKIVNLKKEVERVEDNVREELTSAYERKRKKVENQRKQLDDRHKQIQEAERLLDFYARTGQTEKLAELMEQLNIQYEN